MRLWSINPKYLDTKGLVAVWREGLLAKAVLEEKTVGYKNHPQLDRFKKTQDPVISINIFLYYILEESIKRSYKFDASKIKRYDIDFYIAVNEGQLEHEFNHLQAKLISRDPVKYKENLKDKKIVSNKIFKKKKGPVEDWEKV